jgi:hypothetical protein
MEIQEQVESQPIPVPDRRSSPRFAVDAEARLLLVGHGLCMNCRVLDLSLNGCRMQTGGGIPAGIHVLVEVTFTVNRIPFRLPGVIRRSNGEGEVGIEFAGMSARRREEWAEVVNEVEAIAALKAAEEAAKAKELNPECAEDADPEDAPAA